MTIYEMHRLLVLSLSKYVYVRFLSLSQDYVSPPSPFICKEPVANVPRVKAISHWVM